ncbi:MAG: succinylglutamate-semialdehyde dehydrogenase [Parachlamydiaceae bacterium]|nr:succinylglutamate-semialdehyde dehydrogenase [Parachlamydiaceae bacterium]
MHEVLTVLSDKSLYINGKWVAAKGPSFTSHNPANGELIWQGNAASTADVDIAVASARKAFEVWSNTPYSKRTTLVQSFASLLKNEKSKVAEAISMDMGKPLWESLEEVSSMINKVEISIEAQEQRASLASKEINDALSSTRFRPHGAVAILGPFNFPGHLPNGHIIPALLAGNTVVFKSSELTPFASETIFKIWAEVGLPPGTINLLQGARDTGQLLAVHPGINALFFTGSWKTGQWLSENCAQHSEKILALEMGGNNPLVIGDVSDFVAAAYLTIQSAYLTSGQRCSCARRLIIPKGNVGDNFLTIFKAMVQGIKLGSYKDQEEPFMGPVISTAAAKHLLERQDWLLHNGAQQIIPMRLLHTGGAFLTPGLIDITNATEKTDEELFGPLLQMIRVDDFKAAIREANNTSYGLSAGLLSDSREQYNEFYRDIRAGIINWNMPLTGASSHAPFGGIGKSGNYRPSAYFAVDYCNYPVASLERPLGKLPAKLAPGLHFNKESWV